MPPLQPSGAPLDPQTQLARMLEDAGLDADLATRAKRITIRGPRNWQGFIKNDEGDAETVDLAASASVSITLAPEWDGPAWVPVQPAQRVTVKVGQLPKINREHRTAVILPDIQFGWRRIDGRLEPFHDPQALAIATEIVRRIRPDVVVLLGDTLDLVEQSRYADASHPSFAQTTQAAIDSAHEFLASVAALANGPVVWIEGNHDRRMEAAILRDARAAHGLRPAGTKPESWPVLSIPHLLRLDELEVQYLSGYPAVIYWLPDSDIACLHGEKVRSNGSTAAAIVDDEADAAAVIFGHVHRRELQARTKRGRHGARTTVAATPGCLCRVDGAVPSMHGGTDVFGRPIARPENWQQGLAVVDWVPGTRDHALDLVAINEGRAFFRGDWFTA
jgi:hypothetical protein